MASRSGVLGRPRASIFWWFMFFPRWRGRQRRLRVAKDGAAGRHGPVDGRSGGFGLGIGGCARGKEDPAHGGELVEDDDSALLSSVQNDPAIHGVTDSLYVHGHQRTS